MTLSSELKEEHKPPKRKRRRGPVSLRTTWSPPQAMMSMILKLSLITKQCSSFSRSREVGLTCQIYHSEVAGIQRMDQSIKATPKLQSEIKMLTTLSETKATEAHMEANMKIHMVPIDWHLQVPSELYMEANESIRLELLKQIIIWRTAPSAKSKWRRWLRKCWLWRSSSLHTKASFSSCLLLLVCQTCRQGQLNPFLP